MDKHYCSSADCTKICSGEPQFFFLLFIPHTSAGKKNPESHKRVRAAHPTLFFFVRRSQLLHTLTAQSPFTLVASNDDQHLALDNSTCKRHKREKQKELMSRYFINIHSCTTNKINQPQHAWLTLNEQSFVCFQTK